MLKRFLKTPFLSDVRGSILPLFAIMGAVVFGASGAAVDYTAAIMQRSRLSTALDAATLSVAIKLSTTALNDEQIKKQLSDVLAANLTTAGYSIDQVENLRYELEPATGTITANADIRVHTYFLGVGGIGPDHITVGVESASKYSNVDVELALVLDVTGSMGSDMYSLKKASKDLVDVLIPKGQKERDSKVRISIVPYSQGVNLGSDASKVTAGLSSHQNCVTERMGPKRYKDATYNYNGPNSEFFGGKAQLERQGSRYYGANERCPSTSIVPLTSKRRTLNDAINSLSATGGTAGQVGIAWGWYTISPKWSNLWPSGSDPVVYTDEDVLKFAVLLTDGGFNMDYDIEEFVTNCYYSNSKHRTVCDKEYKWVQSWYSPASIHDDPAKRAKKICDAMKDKGIQIYSIFFNTGDQNFGEDLMEYCASTKQNFYYASSQANLVSAFGNIARKIQAIYVSK